MTNTSIAKYVWEQIASNSFTLKTFIFCDRSNLPYSNILAQNIQKQYSNTNIFVTLKCNMLNTLLTEYLTKLSATFASQDNTYMLQFDQVHGTIGDNQKYTSIVGQEKQVPNVTLLNPYNPKNFKNDKLSILKL
ncbi:hypothetical protein [Candidatus Tisiphia endosymbiont of Micropterix aruncella]|uniref:hypothetical protein n=1 Tax=Candidatus Tisiphia endosymbiont of Micropterix aruncella TaxID=3066271 RepID=UPI003AA986B2